MSQKISLVVTIIFAVIISFCLTFGTCYIEGEGVLTRSVPFLLLQFIATYPLVFLGLMLFVRATMSTRAGDKFTTLLLPSPATKSVLLFAALIAFAWSPWVISQYPGAMNWDTYYQIWMCYPENHPIASDWDTSHEYLPNALSDHHPLFDTLLYGFFARASQELFGTWDYGVFSLVLIQTIGYAFVFSSAIAWMGKMKIPVWTRLTCLLFIMFFPIIPNFAATLIKDSTFGLFFVSFFFIILKIVFEGDRSNKIFLGLAVTAVFCCLSKKTGLYVVTPTLVAMTIILGGRRIKIACASIAVTAIVVMNVILPFALFPALDVAPGGKQEMLSLPFQQTAAVANRHPEDVSEEEREAIDAVLDYSDLAMRYNPQTTDPVKNRFKADSSISQLTDYLSVWIHQGLRHPLTYFDSWLGLTSRFWGYGMEVSYLHDTGDVEHFGSPWCWRPDYINTMNNFMLGIYSALSRTPLLSPLFMTFLYNVLLPLALILSLMTKNMKREALVITAPLAMSFASCLISPVFDTRYCLPFVLIAPLVFAVAFLPATSSKNRLACPKRTK